jgi:hypothetical protein
MLKAYAQSPEMQARYLEMNAITKAHIFKEDGMYVLFLTGEDESIGFSEFSSKLKREVVKYWDDCKVANITLDTKTR